MGNKNPSRCAFFLFFLFLCFATIPPKRLANPPAISGPSAVAAARPLNRTRLAASRLATPDDAMLTGSSPLRPGTHHEATGLAKRMTPKHFCPRRHTIVLFVIFWQTRTDFLTCPAAQKRTYWFWRWVPEIIDDSSALLLLFLFSQQTTQYTG